MGSVQRATLRLRPLAAPCLFHAPLASISSNSWCQNSCVRPSSRSTSRARYSGLPHFPMIVPASPRHSEQSPASPTITFVPIRASCDLISTSCLKHPLRPCQAPYLTIIAGERLLSVTTTVTSKDIQNLLQRPWENTASPRSGVPCLGGAIIESVGISGVSCMPGYESPTLYIRNPAT